MAGGATLYDDDADGGSASISDINVTPLVDIILVLLIIFMVTATYIVSPSIPVQLPRAASGEEVVRTTLALTLQKDGKLFLNGAPATHEDVWQLIRRTLPGRKDLQAIIAADRGVAYGEVIQLIDLVKQAGVRNFALNIERIPEEAASPAAGRRRP